METKEIREKLELAGIAILSDQQIIKLIEFFKVTCLNISMLAEELIDRIKPLLQTYQDTLITELDKTSKYQKYLKRKHNRQLLYEKRKKQGKKL